MEAGGAVAIGRSELWGQTFVLRVPRPTSPSHGPIVETYLDPLPMPQPIDSQLLARPTKKRKA